MREMVMEEMAMMMEEETTRACPPSQAFRLGQVAGVGVDRAVERERPAFASLSTKHKLIHETVERGLEPMETDGRTDGLDF